MRLLVCSALAVVSLACASTAHAADPFTCQGYPEPRVSVEVQDWIGVLGNRPAHAHLAACVPRASSPVSGVVHYDFVVQLHDNAGAVATSIKMHGRTDSGDSAYSGNRTGLGLGCATDQCLFVVPYDFDTTTIPYDGLQEVRPKMHVDRANGTVQLPVLRTVLNVRNGKTVNDFDKRRDHGVGWRNGIGYSAAALDSGIPSAPVPSPWPIRASFFQFGNFEAPTISQNITGYFVSVDPAFHAVPENRGMVVAQGTTACAPGGHDNCSGPSKAPFSVTTAGLAPGVHKLFCRTDSYDPATGDTHSGILVVPFTVGG